VESLPRDAGRYDRLVSQLLNLSFAFCFFPSLFYAIIPAQTVPIAAAIALPVLFLHPIPVTKLTLPFLVFWGVVLFYIPLTALIYPDLAISAIANAGAYISTLVLFLAFYDKLDLIKPKPFLIALVIWSAVGAIQAFPFPDFIKGATEAIGHFMFERFTAGIYATDGGRGYSLLASEPSMSAPTIVLMMLTIVFFHREGKLKGGKLLAAVGVVVFLIALNRSGTIGTIIGMSFIGYLLGRLLQVSGFHRLVVLAIGVILFGGLGMILLSFEFKDVRVLVVLTQLVQFLAGQNNNDIITMAVLMGSERVIPLILGYGSLGHHFGLGHGIGAWNLTEVMDEVKAFVGINAYDYYQYIGQEIAQRTQEKPQSYLSLVSFDMGFVGLLPLLWAIGAVTFYRGKVVSAFGDTRLIYILPAFTWLLFFGLSTLPAPWMLLAYAVHVTRNPAALGGKRNPMARDLQVHASIR
jgi:hypothetical protein